MRKGLEVCAFTNSIHNLCIMVLSCLFHISSKKEKQIVFNPFMHNVEKWTNIP